MEDDAAVKAAVALLGPAATAVRPEALRALGPLSDPDERRAARSSLQR